MPLIPARSALPNRQVLARTVCGWAVAAACAALCLASQPADSIRPWQPNPRYWQYKGRPVVLLGGSKDDNLFQIPDLKEHLDLLASVGGNYIRNTMSDRRDTGHEVYPYRQLPDGKYDLDQFNEEYWRRFESLLELTNQRDIIVQIEIWDRFDYSDVGGSGNWQRHPYNPANNINYTEQESGLQRRYPDHPGADKQPFFHSVPALKNNPVLLRYQMRFVDRMLSCSLRYGNVLYCMDNETNTPHAWGQFWIEHIRKRARETGVQVFLTDMFDDWDPTSPMHRVVYDHPEIYTFVDISQNNHNTGQRHWDNLQWVRDYLSRNPRPMNIVKIYGADTGRYGRDKDGQERFWRNLIGGAASSRFHRPASGLGLNELAQANLRSARMLLREFDIFSAEPDANSSLLSGREQNEAYLSYTRGRQYAVYFPDSGEVTLNLSGQPGPWVLKWLDVLHCRWNPPQPVPTRDSLMLKTPAAGPWVALLVRQDPARNG